MEAKTKEVLEDKLHEIFFNAVAGDLATPQQSLAIQILDKSEIHSSVDLMLLWSNQQASTMNLAFHPPCKRELA